MEVQAAESSRVARRRAQEVYAERRRFLGSRLVAEVKAAEAMAVAAESMEVVMEAKGAAVTVAANEEAAVVEEMVSAAGCQETCGARARVWLLVLGCCPLVASLLEY